MSELEGAASPGGKGGPARNASSFPIYPLSDWSGMHPSAVVFLFASLPALVARARYQRTKLRCNLKLILIHAFVLFVLFVLCLRMALLEVLARETEARPRLGVSIFFFFLGIPHLKTKKMHFVKRMSE